MKYKWLNKKDNKKLIIFFNGWGMDECVVNHLEPDNYDVIMFYDYNTLQTEFDRKSINIYPEKYLIAWSMGVMTATLFDIDYVSKTAVNGTLKPIDDKYGIPNKIYNLTLKGFSPKGAERFIKNMYQDFSGYIYPKREFENQKTELEALTHYQANPNFKYNRIIISACDKIIPTKNQSAFWGIEPNTEGGHAPFNLFKKWSELL
jgi:biotin synthesis protein BioG